MTVGLVLGLVILWLVVNPESYERVEEGPSDAAVEGLTSSFSAAELLEKLAVKGRAPKTGYTRAIQNTIDRLINEGAIELVPKPLASTTYKTKGVCYRLLDLRGIQ